MSTATIKTNDANDLYLPDGKNLQVITGVEACQQNVLEATLMRLGEDIYDTLAGVDYLGTVFTPQQDYDAARASLSAAILNCPDVVSIESLSISIDGDAFNYIAMVNTIYGQIPVSNPS